jgi:hypothetical protein
MIGAAYNPDNCIFIVNQALNANQFSSVPNSSNQTNHNVLWDIQSNSLIWVDTKTNLIEYELKSATDEVVDRLIAGLRQLVLDTTGTLTFNSGSATIKTTGTNSDLTITTVGGDDIFINSGDNIELRGGDQAIDSENEGGDINLIAGNGAGGTTSDADSGGDIRIEAGDAGTSVSGSQSFGGFVTILGGFTTQSGQQGGNINLYAGGSVSGIYGDVNIGDNYVWRFNEGKATFEFPVVNLSVLTSQGLPNGVRAMINDSTVAASGNFGAVAVGGGSFTVPVYCDGTNWYIG